LGNLRLIGRYRHARTDEPLLGKLQRLVSEHGMPLPVPACFRQPSPVRFRGPPPQQTAQ
jgi:hypothetical protein